MEQNQGWSPLTLYIKTVGDVNGEDFWYNRKSEYGSLNVLPGNRGSFLRDIWFYTLDV